MPIDQRRRYRAMARGEVWRTQAESMFTPSYNRICTKYTMEAWSRDNPELCAHVILFCYEEDDINAKDIDDMKAALIKLFRIKAIEGACLAYKLYDQRGVQLPVKQ